MARRLLGLCQPGRRAGPVGADDHFPPTPRHRPTSARTLADIAGGGLGGGGAGDYRRRLANRLVADPGTDRRRLGWPRPGLFVGPARPRPALSPRFVDPRPPGQRRPAGDDLTIGRDHRLHHLWPDPALSAARHAALGDRLYSGQRIGRLVGRRGAVVKCLAPPRGLGDSPRHLVDLRQFGGSGSAGRQWPGAGHRPGVFLARQRFRLVLGAFDAPPGDPRAGRRERQGVGVDPGAPAPRLRDWRGPLRHHRQPGRPGR